MILLVNLVWSTVLYLRFLRGRGSFARLERWQTDYLPVYAVWATVVVIVFPPLFRYIGSGNDEVAWLAIANWCRSYSRVYGEPVAAGR